MFCSQFDTNLAPIPWTRKKKAKSIAIYDFSTLYTTLPHHKLIKRLCNVTDFVFEVGNRHTFVFPKIILHTGEKSPKTT